MDVGVCEEDYTNHKGHAANHGDPPVLHDFPRLGGWCSASEIRDACDYVGGDFYGGPSQYSLACKVFNSLTRVKPFEFHTSRTIGLGDFETTKSLHELTVSSFVATLHSAACLFIDAIKPDGEFDHAAYDLMGAINDMRKPYEPFLGGNLLANVAIYYDRDSFYDPTQNGLSPVDVKHAHACRISRQ